MPRSRSATAAIADKHLNPKAKAAVATSLEQGETIAEASTWSNEKTRRVACGASWQFMNVLLDQDRDDPRSFGPGPEKGRIVDKIHEFLVILEHQNRPVVERRVALRLVIHLVDNLHMPLRDGDKHDPVGDDTPVRFCASLADQERHRGGQ